MAPDDFDEKLTAIHRDLHTIVMAAERAGEALHAARVLTARHKRGTRTGHQYTCSIIHLEEGAPVAISITTKAVTLHGGHCCACAGVCLHIGPPSYCAQHAPVPPHCCNCGRAIHQPPTQRFWNITTC